MCRALTRVGLFAVVLLCVCLPAFAQSTARSATWTSMSNVSFDGATVTKTGGCDGCFDAFVQSEQAVRSAGYAEFTINDPAAFVYAGLARAFTQGDAASIDFGIRIQGGYAEVRENGVYRSDITAQPGAVFRINIAGGVVSYSKDGFVFYSGPASSGPLAFVALFGDMGASISNVVISNGLPPGGIETRWYR